ncbi:MAG: RNA polymerase sigma factor, partial [Acidimicrobiales bacterium]
MTPGPSETGEPGEAFDSARFDRIYRNEVGRCTATLVRVLGDIDLAEDSVAEAFAVAARRWPDHGIPPNPGGWITTTARNRAIDHLRRESKRAERQLASHRQRLIEHDDESVATADLGDLGDLDVVPDDQLRLMFLCCHPALAPDTQVALTLRLLAGLQTPEIARAFLVPEATLAQRLVRAKRKIRDSNISYRIPAAHQLATRLQSVLATIYLVFTEGHTATEGDSLTRSDLSGEAVRLARLLSELLPDEEEPKGLLALLLLTEARREARVDAKGRLVRLGEQDRSRWDRVAIDEGHQLVRDCLRRNNPGPYQLQAAIAAVHGDAGTAAETDWRQIVMLYDHLQQLQPNAMVGLNRSIALAELEGPELGLAALEQLQSDLDRYHLFHATRAEFLGRLGAVAEAANAYDRALELVANEVERRHLRARRAALPVADRPGAPG